MLQARESALGCSATDARHIACKHRQVGGEVKAIPQLANHRARTSADAREVLVARGPGLASIPLMSVTSPPAPPALWKAVPTSRVAPLPMSAGIGNRERVVPAVLRVA